MAFASATNLGTAFKRSDLGKIGFVSKNKVEINNTSTTERHDAGLWKQASSKQQ